MRFYLMNRDRAAAALEVGRNGYIEEVEELGAYLPYGFTSGYSWVAGRGIAGRRAGMGYLMRQLGLDDYSRLIKDTHLVSLNDTFWLRPEGSRLSWADVSPYSNPLDPTLAEAFLDGPGWFDREAIRNRTVPSNSPELATGGQFPKCWERDAGGLVRMCKAGSAEYRGQDHEPYCEALASQLLSAAGVPHVPYALAERGGRLVSMCPLLTDEEVGFVPAKELLYDLCTVEDTLGLAVRWESEELFRWMVVFDCLTANTDRHGGNWGFLVSNETGQPLRMAPLFDHNLSLLPGLRKGDDLEGHLADLMPRIGSGFVETARAMLTPSIRARLEDLRDFEFVDPGGCPEWRVDAANRLLRLQLAAVLDG